MLSLLLGEERALVRFLKQLESNTTSSCSPGRPRPALRPAHLPFLSATPLSLQVRAVNLAPGEVQLLSRRWRRSGRGPSRPQWSLNANSSDVVNLIKWREIIPAPGRGWTGTHFPCNPSARRPSFSFPRAVIISISSRTAAIANLLVPRGVVKVARSLHFYLVALITHS